MILVAPLQTRGLAQWTNDETADAALVAADERRLALPLRGRRAALNGKGARAIGDARGVIEWSLGERWRGHRLRPAYPPAAVVALARALLAETAARSLVGRRELPATVAALNTEQRICAGIDDGLPDGAHSRREYGLAQE